MTGFRGTSLALFTLLALPLAPAAAQPEPLLLYGNQPPRGMFRVEFTSTDDPKLQSAVRPGGGAQFCLDLSKDVGSPALGAGGPTCTSKTLQNTRSTAQIESTCSNGRVTRMTLTRENEKIFAFTAVETGGNEAPRTTKGRYHYEGPCPAGGASGGVSVDRNSAQCQQMRAQLGSTTLESACGQIPAGASRDACIKQMEPLFKVLKSCD